MAVEIEETVAGRISTNSMMVVEDIEEEEMQDNRINGEIKEEDIIKSVDCLFFACYLIKI